MRVAAYTGGIDTPSARLRVRQYISPLRERGISVTEFPLPWGNILPRSRLARPIWMGSTLIHRLGTLPRSWNADVSWISRQLLPAFVPLQRLTGSPRILDVDDAVWLNTGGRRARELARACLAVVCGNSFLAEQFAEWNSNVSIIPTAIDTDYIRPPTTRRIDLTPTIGWTGTEGNLAYLYSIEKSLSVVLEKNPKARLLIISNAKPTFSALSHSQIDFVRWTATSESKALLQTTVGIMPILDNDWCRGKCSFKMLCYMGCGMPVVVSPWGMNKDVLALGPCGFGPTSHEEWVDTLHFLLNNPEESHNMGAEGRKIVMKHFSLQQLASKYTDIFLAVSKLTQPSAHHEHEGVSLD